MVCADCHRTDIPWKGNSFFYVIIDPWYANVHSPFNKVKGAIDSYGVQGVTAQIPLERELICMYELNRAFDQLATSSQHCKCVSYIKCLCIRSQYFKRCDNGILHDHAYAMELIY